MLLDTKTCNDALFGIPEPWWPKMVVTENVPGELGFAFNVKISESVLDAI